jgi:hypothetical protein
MQSKHWTLSIVKGYDEGTGKQESGWSPVHQTHMHSTHQEGGIMSQPPAFTANEPQVNDAWNEHLSTESPLVRRNPITIVEEKVS